jgi:hydrogenase expression/formation protein HypC
MNMCLGVIGRVIVIDGNMCVADVFGVTRRISIELLDRIGIGDYIMIHAGCAIEVVDKKEAVKTIEILKELQESMYE